MASTYFGTIRLLFGSFVAYPSLIWEPTDYRVAYSWLIRRLFGNQPLNVWLIRSLFVAYLGTDRLSFGLFVAHSLRNLPSNPEIGVNMRFHACVSNQPKQQTLAN